MACRFDTISDLLNHGFDTLVDARSPSEFTLDHIPGAINLPSLFDDEREKVGTTYVQNSPFEARKIGAALLARNAADHVEQHMADHDGSWRPLLYCWRGGQRSGAFATILKQIGWRADTLDNGYMQWRRLVKTALYDNPVSHPLVLLDGNTGTGKTAILSKLSSMGIQTIDLEQMAGHRGSLLGAMHHAQPSQKWFETQLASTFATLDPNRPTVIEAESAKIGKINVPKQVWKAMQAAPRILISAPSAERAKFLAKTYSDIASDPAELARRLAPLRMLRGNTTIDHWLTLIQAGDLQDAATAMIADHYDPAYTKARKSCSFRSLGHVTAQSLDDTGQLDVAQKITDIIRSSERP